MKENYPKSSKTEILLSLPSHSWVGINQKSFKEGIKRETQAPSHILNNNTISILIGSLLGDGSLRLKKGCKNAILREMHKFSHKDYVVWKSKFFSIIGLHYTKIKGKHPQYNYQTKASKTLTKYYHLFYPNGKKIVTKEILDMVTPLALAVWCMDDGCFEYYHKTYMLCTNCFSYKGLVLMQKMFKEKYGLFPSIKKVWHKDNEYILKFYQRETKKLIDIIQPVVLNQIPKCMHYKIGLDKKKMKKFGIKIKGYNKKWREKNPNYMKEYKRKYYQEHKDNPGFKLKRKEYDKQYSKRPEVKVRKAQKLREWRKKNPEKIKEYSKKYYQNKQMKGGKK